MEFEVNLIKIGNYQNEIGWSFLRDNCTYISDKYYFYEGDEDVLLNDVECELIANGVVPSLGDLSKYDLIKLVKDRFNVLI